MSYEEVEARVAEKVAKYDAEVPLLSRAVELLWQGGHPRIGSDLEAEVRALVDEVLRLRAVLAPIVVGGDGDR